MAKNVVSPPLNMIAKFAGVLVQETLVSSIVRGSKMRGVPQKARIIAVTCTPYYSFILNMDVRDDQDTVEEAVHLDSLSSRMHSSNNPYGCRPRMLLNT